MSPIFQWAIGIAAALFLSRTCPTCGKAQVVPRRDRGEPVPCKHCGAPIPPKEH